jgi:anti-anti-sigma regulatory factor
MDIATYEVKGRVPVTVLQPQGDVDGRTFQELIGKAQEACNAGARAMVIDLSGVRYLSSAGLMAIQSIARLLQGQQVLNPEAGWSAMHTVKNEVAEKHGPDAHLKLVNPQPAVDKVLQMAGFTHVFEVHADVKAAVASF